MSVPHADIAANFGHHQLPQEPAVNLAPASQALPHSNATEKPSRQFLTAQKLKLTGAKLWACDRCYRLKNKCDSARPKCNVCSKGSHECTYLRRKAKQDSPASTRSLPAKPSAYKDMLQTRLYEVEEAARVMSSPDDSQHLDLEEQLRSLDVGSGDLPQSPNTPDFLQDSELFVPQPNQYSALPPDQTLFAQPTILYLLQVFFADINPLWYPNPIHQSTFFSRFHEQLPVLVYAMCAAASSRSNHPATRAYVAERGIPLYQGGEPYAQVTQDMIDQYTGQPSFDVVLAMATLGLALSTMGNVDASVRSMTMATQSALLLRLDVDPDIEEVHGNLSWLERESRRRLWWTLCMYDRQPKPGFEAIPTRLIDDQYLSSVDQYCLNGVCTSSSTNPPAPEQLWNSVRDPLGLPIFESFSPTTDIDFGTLSGRLARVFYSIQDLHQSLHGSADQSAIQMAIQISSPSTSRVPNPPTSSAALESEALIAIELEAIMGSLPEWALSIDNWFDFSPDLTSRSPPPWQLLTQHIVYHALTVCLYLPTVLGAVDNLRTHLAEDDHVARCYHRCRYHATVVASHCRKIMAVNPMCRFIDWFTLYLAFRCALVFIVVLKTETDRDELVHARKDLEIHLEVTRSVGRHMWFGSWISKMIESIIMEA
ncbi:hypothetical protein HDU89_005410 [Geranomyces variabilis]|nr:hypothetical protein HDU89_005410 [Geranomyces variabilis]